MYGITGFVDNTQSLCENDLLHISGNSNTVNTGTSGVFFERTDHYAVGLARKKASGLKPGDALQQPVTSSCGLYTVILNGAIYNHIELRETLIKYGIIFKTLTDSEVLLECYKKWGQKMFDKLDGAFSFALFDKKQKQLIVAKDTIGTKPLFYYQAKGFYAFASEIKTLLSFPAIAKKINTNVISTYFRYGYFIGDESIYQDIFPVKNGTLRVIDLHSGNYYDAPILVTTAKPAEEPETDKQKVIARVEELLTESILNRNTASSPPGVLLTSGYDSATLTALLQRNLSRRIKTFAIGFEDPEVNEAPRAKKIAEHLKTNHREFYFGKKEAVKLLETLPDIFEEPIGDSAALAFLFMAQHIRAEAKVLLGTEGADVLFGGYRSYIKAAQVHALPGKIPSAFKGFFNQAIRFTSPKMREAVQGGNLLEVYQNINACFTTDEINRLLAESEFHIPPVKKGEKGLRDLMAYDFEHYLPKNLLYKSDKCFMHYGIENRDAFLKADLANYLSKLDDEWFIKNRQGKQLLCEVVHQYVPQQMMDERKRGFTIPLQSWLQDCFKPYIELYLSPARLSRHQLLNPTEVAKIKRRFYTNPNINHAKKVWLLLQFQMWYEKWME